MSPMATRQGLRALELLAHLADRRLHTAAAAAAEAGSRMLGRRRAAVRAKPQLVVPEGAKLAGLARELRTECDRVPGLRTHARALRDGAKPQDQLAIRAPRNCSWGPRNIYC